MKKFFLILLLVLAVAVLAFVKFYKNPKPLPVQPKPEPFTTAVLGKSVEGRNIESITFGGGPKKLVFVGGVHGGYEWNSVLLAYEFIDYLKTNPSLVASSTSITIIPSLNPDGVYKVLGKEGRFTLSDTATTTKFIAGTGRFNAHSVDLNRNFDCKWKPKSTWQSKPVSAGTAAFSEPEAAALRDFVMKEKPTAFVFFHSQANAVYASECEKGILPETLAIMDTYAKAAGYPAVKSFDAYAVSGDAEGWLASIGIPAITVELKTHESTEWDRNLSGIKALLEYYRLK